MNKILLVLGMILLSGGAYFLLQKTNEQKPAEMQTREVPLPTKTTTQETAINPEDVIRTFFQKIGNKEIPDAISMMTTSAVPDDSTKQAWGVQFAAFDAISISSIEPSMKEEWTEANQTYKIKLDITMSPESANNPIPFFGYENGINIRWIPLEKEGGVWKVAGVNTGP